MIEVAPEVIVRCQKGDTAAFDELVSLIQNSVYGIAVRIMGNHEDAQDAAQEAFLRIWQGLPAFRGESQFSTWLYRVVVNTCLNRKRQLRWQLQIVDSEGILEGIAEPREGPLKAALQSESNRTIWKAVDTLSEKYRLVITLFYQEELSYAEIAELLLLPVGTVKAHLNRARVALAKLLPERDFK